MHITIDIVAGIILLFFFLAGWHKGFLLSLLGVIRVILAYSAAYFAGRYAGEWLAETAYRPRIVTIPVVAGLTFTLITFLFHIMMTEIRKRHYKKEEEDEAYRHSFLSSLGGSTINLGAGFLSLILLFWLAELFLVGSTGTGIPGADKARFSRLARRTVYEVSLRILPAREYPSQAASLARMISNPEKAMNILQKVVAADSIRQIAGDKQLAADIMTGDPERIRQNAAIQQFFNDRETLEDLRDLGMLSGNETRTALCEKLARVGQNDRIRAGVNSLKARGMLSTEKIPLLIRDPAFDAIVAELLH